MSRQHQVLARSATVLDPARYDDQSRGAPEDLEPGPVGPFPSRPIGTVIPGILQRLVAVCRNTFYTLYDVKRPRCFSAERWRSLGGVPNHLFDKSAFYRARRIRANGSPSVDRFDYIHELPLIRRSRNQWFWRSLPCDIVGREQHEPVADGALRRPWQLTPSGGRSQYGRRSRAAYGCSSPSTGMFRPLIQCARGEARKTMTSATSSPMPNRPIGKPWRT